FCQTKDRLVAFPRSDIRLGVSDVQGQLQMVVIHASVALFHRHLVAVRGAILVEPTGIGKVVRVDDERVSLPMADGVSIPARVRIVARKFSAIRPYVAPDAIISEELNDFAGS